MVCLVVKRTTSNKKYWQRCRDTESSNMAGGLWNGAAAWKTVWQFFKKKKQKKHRMITWSSNSIPRYISRRTEGRDSKIMFTAALFTISQSWAKPNQLHLPIDWWVDKPNSVYPCNRLFFSLKKEWNSDACCSMEETWKHAKWKQLDTRRQLCGSTLTRHLE